MKLKPDMMLGPGDTAPVYKVILRWPKKADGTPGDVVNVANATGIMRFQSRGRSVAFFDIPVTPVGTQEVGDPDEGKVTIDFEDSPGNIASGDYIARAIMQLQDGRQVSIPNGRIAGIPADLAEFFWLHVAADFTVVV